MAGADSDVMPGRASAGPEIWVGTGWKMNKTIGEALAYAEALRAGVKGRTVPARLFVLPPFTALAAVSEALRDSAVMVGAQTMHWADSGAHTGEISAPMLRDCGAVMVELGHSERRRDCGETDETVNLKVRAALRHGLRPLICVGETAEEKAAGQAQAVLSRQVTMALREVEPLASGELLLAYEPVWAIGDAGAPAEPAYAEAMQKHIKGTAAALGWSEPVPVLYGGSVDARNCPDFVRMSHIDGVFVGRAAWTVEGFLAVIAAVEEALASV